MMNKPPFTMGQTKKEEYPGAAASSASRPFNFAGQDFRFNFNAKSSNSTNRCSSSGKETKRSPHKRSPPPREQPGRPSTPYPENEVHFVATDSCGTPPHQASAIDVVSGMGNEVGDVFSASNLVPSGHQLAGCRNENANFQGDAPDHRRSVLTQQQSWPPYHMSSLSPSNELPPRNPFVTAQRAMSYDVAQVHGVSPPSIDREERVPNSAVRRSRVWKYGRRSSGGHCDRQPFTFSVPAGSQANLTGGARLYGKRAFSTHTADDSWSTEPSHKQFISEERMMNEMHNLSIDGLSRPPLFPVPPSTSPPSASSSLSTSPVIQNLPHDASPPSASGQCSHHGNSHSSSDLLRFHQCNHHHPRSRSYAEAVLADIERRLDDSSDDEGVEEDMPPSQADSQQRLQMTPQLVSALKAKGSASHLLPQDIVKKIAMSPCMELVLWRPPFSGISPRGGGGQDPPSQSPQSSPSSSLASELPPIMEVEVEREDGEVVDASRIPLPPDVYDPGLPAPDGMQDDALPDFDEDMDL